MVGAELVALNWYVAPVAAAHLASLVQRRRRQPWLALNWYVAPVAAAHLPSEITAGDSEIIRISLRRLRPGALPTGRGC